MIVPPKLPSKHDAAVKLLPSEANSTRKNPATDLNHVLDKLHHTTELQHVSQAPKIEQPQKNVSDAAMTKVHRDPKSLQVAEPKTLLRAAGQSVSGHKAELLDRLMGVGDDDDYFSIDEDGNRLPPRDMNPQLDPASLVGHRIQRFQISADPGSVLPTDQGPVAITFPGVAFSKYADSAADAAFAGGTRVRRASDRNVVPRLARAERETREKKEKRSADRKRGGRRLEGRVRTSGRTGSWGSGARGCGRWGVPCSRRMTCGMFGLLRAGAQVRGCDVAEAWTGRGVRKPEWER
ncbi:hypothetical protein HO133_006844 [Letharia lupina]|uniref:SAP domain-containing protein n=1 Tax=Letharia lupina TaxID=560253 RepID=A0A8H6F715_9LECA|nr:uncharacterized protein HO133_006844 [Letharia lupina]KAF6217506.1 hypothetical protein HO133_006844 [Letharia lupina]